MSVRKIPGMVGTDGPGGGDRGVLALEMPRVLRAVVRAKEGGLILLGAVIGVLAGFVVVSMSFCVTLIQAISFGVKGGDDLSSLRSLEAIVALTIPLFGGVFFGLTLWVLLRWRPAREVDPIEANALHGGRMSLLGSLIVAMQTMWSSGFGASVGLEAGYTQLASGIASRIGRAFHVRRSDLRMLVGCGAAGAIAAAFGAPLAGAFYAFELVIGTYSVASLAPVGIAALLGCIVSNLFHEPVLLLGLQYISRVRPMDFALSVMIGVISAGVGIGLMRGVAMCEAVFDWARVRPVIRPAIGGLIVGALALITPGVLSSGHGALQLSFMLESPATAIATLFALKLLASTVSLGAGFRGGLFFASLLAGALGGRLFAELVTALYPATSLDPYVYMVVGMGALSVSVIGGPLTMTFLALEMTGDFWLTALVLTSVLVAAQVTRELFGYSFATWRFHLRGESIRSAADIGWIRELTVRRMMRTDVRTVPAHTTISRFRLVFPLGSVAQVVALDERKRYAGIVHVPEAHSNEVEESQPVRGILHHCDTTLTPNMTVKEAVVMFDQSEAEAIAVVETRETQDVLGLLTEAYVLRRYSAELEQRQQD